MKHPNSFTHHYHGISGALITEVLVSRFFDPMVGPRPEFMEILAVWDTGATNTAITYEIAAKLGLKPITSRTVNTANGARKSDVFLINLMLPNKFGIPGIAATAIELAGDIDMLVGMDVIGLGDFAITNLDGKTSFSFRSPSFQRIDFVADAHKAQRKRHKSATRKRKKR